MRTERLKQQQLPGTALVDVTPEGIIYHALKLLADPKKWVKHVFLARRKGGGETSALADDAESFSIIGALRRAAFELGLPATPAWAPVLWDAYDLAEAALPYPYNNLMQFNNDSFVKHKDVLDLLERAMYHEKGAKRAA